MRIFKGFISICLAVTLILGMSVFAFCETINLTELEVGRTYTVGGESILIFNDTGHDVHYLNTRIEDGYFNMKFGESHPGTLYSGNNLTFSVLDTRYYVSENPYYNTLPIRPTESQPAAHNHIFVWQTITEPTPYCDGLEGEVCSCGATRNTQPISAFGYTINDYAAKMVNASKSGQVIKLELGEWNSFPKAFMEKVAAKSAQNVTFVFHYKWNHVKQEITIPAGTVVDTSLDWYGPAKMVELYGTN